MGRGGLLCNLCISYIGVGEDELSDLGVEGVSVNALASGQDQGRAGTIGAVSSSNHLGAGAENVGKLTSRALLLLTAENVEVNNELVRAESVAWFHCSCN